MYTCIGMYVYIYVYIYIHVCVYVCVYILFTCVGFYQANLVANSRLDVPDKMAINCCFFLENFISEIKHKSPATHTPPTSQCNPHCNTHCNTHCNNTADLVRIVISAAKLSESSAAHIPTTSHCNTHYHTHCNTHLKTHCNTHCNTLRHTLQHWC